MMKRRLGIVVLALLLGLLAGSGVVQANPDALDVCCAWDGSLSDGDLTYRISGGDDTAQDIVRAAVEEWETAVTGLTLTEISGNTKPDVDIKFKRGGGMIAGSAQRSFDNQGFVKSVRVQISGKAFGDPNNAATTAEIVKHEFGHALGLGHADFQNDLMWTSVNGVSNISVCDIDGVLAANHWKLVDGGPTPHANHVSSVDCGTATPLADDLAVTGVSAPSSAVVGDSVVVSVTVANEGTNGQTNFDVTLTDTTEAGLIDTVTVSSLAAGGSTVVLFSWNTAGRSLGGHVLEAEAVLVGDEDTADNTATTTVTLTDGSAAVYHVETMTFTVTQRGPWYNFTATMTIRDADNAVAPEGVTVSGSISREDRTFPYSPTTNASGVVQFKLRTQFTETLYTVQVTGANDGAGSGFDDTSGVPCKTIIIHNDATFLEGACP